MKMPATTSYAYDFVGNRLTQTATTRGAASSRAYSYEPGTDRLASVTSEDEAFSRAYSYDLAGCVTSIVSTASPVGFDRRADRSGSADGPSALVGADLLADRILYWNSLRQLISVSTNGVPAESYTYDALGRRATTTTAEGTVRHVYDGIHCIADTDESGTILRTYVWGPGLDNLLSVAVAGGDGHVRTYYALTDHQSTVHGFADTNGAIAVRYAYDAWGNLLSEECSVPAHASNRYRFQGREWSAATGLTNFRARWYDLETGRWLSKDPIGLAGGLNHF